MSQPIRVFRILLTTYFLVVYIHLIFSQYGYVIPEIVKLFYIPAFIMHIVGLFKTVVKFINDRSNYNQ